MSYSSAPSPSSRIFFRGSCHIISCLRVASLPPHNEKLTSDDPRRSSRDLITFSRRVGQLWNKNAWLLTLITLLITVRRKCSRPWRRRRRVQRSDRLRLVERRGLRVPSYFPRTAVSERDALQLLAGTKLISDFHRSGDMFSRRFEEFFLFFCANRHWENWRGGLSSATKFIDIQWSTNSRTVEKNYLSLFASRESILENRCLFCCFDEAFTWIAIVVCMKNFL